MANIQRLDDLQITLDDLRYHLSEAIDAAKEVCRDGEYDFSHMVGNYEADITQVEMILDEVQNAISAEHLAEAADMRREYQRAVI